MGNCASSQEKLDRDIRRVEIEHAEKMLVHIVKLDGDQEEVDVHVEPPEIAGVSLNRELSVLWGSGCACHIAYAGDSDIRSLSWQQLGAETGVTLQVEGWNFVGPLDLTWVKAIAGLDGGRVAAVSHGQVFVFGTDGKREQTFTAPKRSGMKYHYHGDYGEWNDCVQSLVGLGNSFAVGTESGKVMMPAQSQLELQSVWEIPDDPDTTFSVKHPPPLASLGDGRFVAACDLYSQLHIFSAAGQCERVLKLLEKKSKKSKENIVPFGFYLQCLAYVPERRGRIAATVGSEIHIWNLFESNGLACTEQFPYMKLQSGEVQCLAVLPDGRLISGGRDKTLRVWNADGDCEARMVGHRKEVRCVVALDDGRIISGSEDSTVRIWTKDGECEAILQEHIGNGEYSNHSMFESPAYVENLVDLRDGRIAASYGGWGSADLVPRIWSTDIPFDAK